MKQALLNEIAYMTKRIEIVTEYGEKHPELIEQVNRQIAAMTAYKAELEAIANSL